MVISTALAAVTAQRVAPSVAPGGMTASPKIRRNIYVCGRGDFISQIADKFNMTWQELYNANRSKLSNDPTFQIPPGTNLVIP